MSTSVFKGSFAAVYKALNELFIFSCKNIAATHQHAKVMALVKQMEHVNVIVVTMEVIVQVRKLIISFDVFI